MNRSPAASDGGHFGVWTADEDGLPAFDVQPTRPAVDLVLPAGDVTGLWHHLGNDEVTAMAHVGGWTTLWATARGTVRLTGPRSRWGPTDGTGRPSTRRGIGARWGLGYAAWRLEGDGWEARRRVWVPPGDRPLLVVDVELVGTGGPLPGSVRAWEERWVTEPRHLFTGGLMSRYRRPPAGYPPAQALLWRGLYGSSHLSRRLTDAARTSVAPLLRRRPRAGSGGRSVVTPPRWSVPDPRRPPTSPTTRAATTPVGAAWVDLAVPWLAVVALDDDRPVSVRGPALSVQLADRPGPHRLRFAVVLPEDPSDLESLAAQARTLDASEAARSWAGLLDLTLDADPPTPSSGDLPPESGPGSPRDGGPPSEVPARVGREARWHAVQLVGARQRDAHLGRYVAQGSAYQFVHGLHGAPRDYALFAVPLAWFAPAASRDLLEVMLRMGSRDGTTHYAHTGRGRTTSGGIHAAPTDLPIFLLWAITEYIWTTGDRGFLDQHVPFTDGGGSSVRDRIGLATHTLVERVGFGPHGLLRVGSGDWADPISAMVPDRRAFHRRGESGFNTAFAAYALPRAADLIAPDDPELAREMRATGDALAGAMAATWTGEWFLRGYDGRGGPVGDRHLFLDGQVWALIGGIGTPSQRASLVAAIADHNDDPSPVGATILDRPHPVRAGMLAPGWDCNGGVWAAIGGLLTWAYALHDPPRAWRSVADHSLAAHATAYPHIWFGIWSGPDAYNAHFSEEPGGTFVQPATPMTEHPIGNANAHAGPLLGLLRTLGLEAGPDGPVVADRGPRAPRWELRTPVGTWRH